MTIITVELFIHKTTLGEVQAVTSDMSKFGWPLLGKREVQVLVPKVDESAAEIDALKQQAEGIMGEAKKKAGDIQAQIQSIKDNKND